MRGQCKRCGYPGPGATRELFDGLCRCCAARRRNEYNRIEQQIQQEKLAWAERRLSHSNPITQQEAAAIYSRLTSNENKHENKPYGWIGHCEGFSLAKAWGDLFNKFKSDMNKAIETPTHETVEGIVNPAAIAKVSPSFGSKDQSAPDKPAVNIGAPKLDPNGYGFIGAQTGAEVKSSKARITMLASMGEAKELAAQLGINAYTIKHCDPKYKGHRSGAQYRFVQFFVAKDDHVALNHFKQYDVSHMLYKDNGDNLIPVAFTNIW